MAAAAAAAAAGAVAAPKPKVSDPTFGQISQYRKAGGDAAGTAGRSDTYIPVTSAAGAARDRAPLARAQVKPGPSSYDIH